MAKKKTTKKGEKASAWDLPPALISDLIQKAGGEEAVLRAYYLDRARSEVKAGRTFGELRDLARSEGWEKALLTMRISDLYPAPTPKLGRSRGPRRPRMTPQQIGELDNGILDTLADAPLGARQIAERVGYDLATVRARLRKLADLGRVSPEGPRRSRVYRLITHS